MKIEPWTWPENVWKCVWVLEQFRVWGVSGRAPKGCSLLPAMGIIAVEIESEATCCLKHSLNKFWLLFLLEDAWVARPLFSLSWNFVLESTCNESVCSLGVWKTSLSRTQNPEATHTHTHKIDKLDHQKIETGSQKLYAWKEFQKQNQNQKIRKKKKQLAICMIED